MLIHWGCLDTGRDEFYNRADFEKEKCKTPDDLKNDDVKVC